MERKTIRPIIKKETLAMRQCGHPFFPTFDCIAQDGKHVTSYCLYCVIERLGVEPCSKCYVDNMDDWLTPEKIKWVFNK